MSHVKSVSVCPSSNKRGDIRKNSLVSVLVKGNAQTIFVSNLCLGWKATEIKIYVAWCFYNENVLFLVDPDFDPNHIFFLLFLHEKTKQKWKFISIISETNLILKSLCWTKVLLNKQIKISKLTIAVDSPNREWIAGLQLRWLWFLFQWCFEILWILEI